MMWLRWLRVFSANTPLCPPAAPQWTEGDSRSLAAFQASATGRKLIRMTRFEEQSINASAVSRKGATEYNCGYAAGFRAHAAWHISLSANVPPHTDDSSENGEGAPDLAEMHAP
jgi:hypothetical protein